MAQARRATDRRPRLEDWDEPTVPDGKPIGLAIMPKRRSRLVRVRCWLAWACNRVAWLLGRVSYKVLP